MDSKKQVEKPEGNFLLLKAVVCLALLWCGFPAFASETPTPKKILLLYSYQSVLPGILEWDEGIRSGLQGMDPGPLEFYTEYLDLARFPDEPYVKSLITLLQNKYSSKKIDLLFLDSGQAKGPGLLVLDVRMPGLSGLALQKILAASGCRLPIIFITAFDNDQERAQGLAAGAVAYLRKPFQEHKLMEAIEAGLHHAARPSG